MIPEALQFAAVIAVAAVAFVAWLAVIYLPRRTMEQRYDSSAHAEDDSREGNSREVKGYPERK